MVKTIVHSDSMVTPCPDCVHSLRRASSGVHLPLTVWFGSHTRSDTLSAWTLVVGITPRRLSPRSLSPSSLSPRSLIRTSSSVTASFSACTFCLPEPTHSSPRHASHMHLRRAPPRRRRSCAALPHARSLTQRIPYRAGIASHHFCPNASLLPSDACHGPALPRRAILPAL